MSLVSRVTPVHTAMRSLRRFGLTTGPPRPWRRGSEIKKKRVEDTILRPLMGIDFPQFQALVSQSASSQVLGQLLGMIMQHNLGLDLMIAGIDEGVGHLGIVTHPGMAVPMDTVGTSAIGSGGLHASVRLNLGRPPAPGAAPARRRA
jgi:hypothetical protein